MSETSTPRFWDSSKAFHYTTAREVGRRIVEDPSLIQAAKTWLADHPIYPPAQALWQEVLHLPPAEIAARMIEDSVQGQELRDDPICWPGAGLDRFQTRSGVLSNRPRRVGKRPEWDRAATTARVVALARSPAVEDMDLRRRLVTEARELLAQQGGPDSCRETGKGENR